MLMVHLLERTYDIVDNILTSWRLEEMFLESAKTRFDLEIQLEIY